MPVYSYKVIDAKGRSRTGAMPAETEAGLESKLADTGVWLVEAKLLKTSAKSTKPVLFATKVKRRDLIEFCTLMTFQCRIGIPLVQCLALASQDCENRGFRSIIQGVQRQVESGALFYEALEKYPGTFTPHFTNVIRAGETSGHLPDSFNDLRAYYEWTEGVMNEVRQASLYPAIVLAVVFAFTIGLFTWVIPKFAALLDSLHTKLPLLSQIVFGLSHAIKATWWMWVLGVPLVVGGLLLLRRLSRRVDLFMDRVKLNMPIFGEINTMLAISRFTHNLCILYRAEIPIVHAIHLCRGLIGSAVVEQAVANVEESVKTGSTISEAMRREPIFPQLLLRMVIMGETTGNLDAALDNVSTYYNEVVPRRIKKVLTLLEPALTLFLIFMVGCIALSIYLPILALMGAIH